MMGNKKLSEIRAELRAAFARDGFNPIASLDRKIRKLEKNPKTAKTEAKAELRSLFLLRNALAQVVDDKPPKRSRPSRAKRPSKAGR
jgi:hypothetical protein